MSSALLTRTGSTTTTFTVAKSEPQNALVVDLKPSKHVTWDDSVVDNEHLGKKSSKKCCIYHKPRAWDESSSESSSDGGPARPRKPPCHHSPAVHDQPVESSAPSEPVDPHDEQELKE